MINFACATCNAALTRADKEAGAATACHGCGQGLQVPYFQGDNVIVTGEVAPKQDGYIRFPCQQCGTTLKATPQMVGGGGKCPRCKHPFTVPSPVPPSHATVPPASPMIVFACPKCRTTLQRPDVDAGNTTHCPCCSQMIIVPSIAVVPTGVRVQALAPSVDDGSAATRDRRSQHPLVSARGLATAGAVLFITLVVLGVGYALFDSHWRSSRSKDSLPMEDRFSDR
jgi:hypothetical protein